MNKLGKRLTKIASLVTGDSVCDVGCDHGKLTKFLFDKKKIKKAIVSDISLPSLQKAIDLLGSQSYDFESICCDGLTGYIGKNVSECIISGMGGDEIIKIINNSPIIINSYILSPQHNNIEVKKFMIKNGYTITFDIIIKDKTKFYNIFKCEKSEDITKMSEYDLLFGKDNFTDADSAINEFVENEIFKIINIRSQNNFENDELNKYYDLLINYKERK